MWDGVVEGEDTKMLLLLEARLFQASSSFCGMLAPRMYEAQKGWEMTQPLAINCQPFSTHRMMLPKPSLLVVEVVWAVCEGEDPKPNPFLKGSPSRGASLVPFQSPAINKESLAEQLLERTSWDPVCESHMVQEGWVEEQCQKPVGICHAGVMWEAFSAMCHVINGARSQADISICSFSLCSSWKSSSCIGLGP